jgi:hypothetical protein
MSTHESRPNHETYIALPREGSTEDYSEAHEPGEPSPFDVGDDGDACIDSAQGFSVEKGPPNILGSGGAVGSRTFPKTIEKSSEEPAPQNNSDSEEYRVKLAAAKIIGGFTIREQGSVELERASVYGAAILMPQVARTVGWPRYLTALVVETYLFLIANFVVQGGLLFMIAKEESVMDVFAGQMHLCDYGAGMSHCPGHSWCRGPGGTEITPPRLYDFKSWSSRSFARDSLAALFPNKAGDIRDKVDPGEYGIESNSCRWLCCFIFMMSVMSEFSLNVRMLRLLWVIPTTEEPWIALSDDLSADWVCSAEIKLAGMSAAWKFVNLLVVFVPKMMLWKLTAEAGICFLMETSTIEDIIVNSVALTFVLRIDEMFFELMHDSIKMCLQCHEEKRFFDEEEEEDISDEDLMAKHSDKQDLRYWSTWDTFSLLPPRLMAVTFFTLLFVGEYYWQRCYYAGGFHFFSRPMYLPKSVEFSFLSAFFRNPWFFQNPSDDEPFWSMPSDNE